VVGHEASARGQERFVVAELQGRLGNQLFQFAAAHAIARVHDARLVFSSTKVAPDDLLLPQLLGDAYVEATARELLQVGQFAYEVPLRRAWASVAYHVARASRRVRRETPPSATYWEQTGAFRESVFTLALPLYLQGHLQSERYFAAVAQEIVDRIRWPEAARRLPSDAHPAVAVSFRRGDYNSLGWALPLDYYDRALDIVAARAPGSTLVLFGDDLAFLELVGERLRSRGPVVSVADLGTDPISQLRIMSECDHCVIANSSFAWWGAWIGDQRPADANRIVVAPEEYGWPDRVPDRWITLPTGIPRT
jgi:hypothetical protein